MTRTTPYPEAICLACGTEHGHQEVGRATWTVGTCDICGREEMLTEPRDFGHLKPTWEEGKK